MQGVERPQATEIEDRSQVDEERIVPRAREDLAVATEFDDALVRGVRRRVGAWPDVRGRHAEVRPESVEPDFVTLVTEYVCLTLRLSAWFAGVSIGPVL